MTIEQSTPESIADRIAAQFDEQPELPQQEQPEEPQEEIQAEPEEAEAQPEFVDVEFGGKSYQVPPELKDALMAQSDYTRKTTEVAEKARLVELEHEQIKLHQSEKKFEASVKDDILAMQRIDFQLEQYKGIDATGLSSDQLWQLSRQIDALKDERTKLSGKVTDKYNQYQQETAKLASEIKSKALEIAQKSVPNWSEQTQKQLRDYAESVGFKGEEVNAISDPRVVKVLWQASQYAKLQSAKVTAKVTSSPAVKPGSSNPMPQSVKDKFAFKKAIQKAPNSQAKAKAIEAELMRRF